MAKAKDRTTFEANAMKHASKSEFLERTEHQWQKLWADVQQLLDQEPPAKQKEAVRKTLAHLYAWHVLLSGWLKTGPNGKPDLPYAGYSWRETPALNRMLDKKYADLDYASTRRRLRGSHTRLMNFVRSLSEKEFMKPNQYSWTGQSTLCGYIGANSFSHYRWAQKKIKVIAKSCNK